MSAATGITDVVNYLVPATGSTKVMVFSQVFGVVPFSFDFRQTDIDQEQFRPSGLFIDNTNGTGPVVVTINEMNYTITCPIGGKIAQQYPAPMAQSVSIVGLGQATVIFCDFPVIPFGQAVASGGGGGTGVVIPGYPAGATPVSTSRTALGAAAIACYLPNVVGKTNYITSIIMTFGGATAASLAPCNIYNCLGGDTTVFVGVPAGPTVAGITLNLNFMPGLPAIAANTLCGFQIPSLGTGNTSCSCIVSGYQI